MLYTGGRGVGNDQSIADCISDSRTAINIGQKLAGKEPLGLKISQLICSHTTAHYQKIILAPHENKHSSKISTLPAADFENRHQFLNILILWYDHVSPLRSSMVSYMSQ